jgi:hypothetical protein
MLSLVKHFFVYILPDVNIVRGLSADALEPGLDKSFI